MSCEHAHHLKPPLAPSCTHITSTLLTRTRTTSSTYSSAGRPFYPTPSSLPSLLSQLRLPRAPERSLRPERSIRASLLSSTTVDSRTYPRATQPTTTSLPLPHDLAPLATLATFPGPPSDRLVLATELLPATLFRVGWCFERISNSRKLLVNSSESSISLCTVCYHAVRHCWHAVQLPKCGGQRDDDDAKEVVGSLSPPFAHRTELQVSPKHSSLTK